MDDLYHGQSGLYPLSRQSGTPFRYSPSVRKAARIAERPPALRRRTGSHLVGRQRGRPPIRPAPSRRFAKNSRPSPLPLHRTAARRPGYVRSVENKLGHRRRRKRPRRPSHAKRLGNLHPRPMPRSQSPRSSSNNGAASAKRKTAGCLTGVPTMNTLDESSRPFPREKFVWPSLATSQVLS